MAERRRRGFQNMETWKMIGCVKDHVFTILGPCLLRHVVVLYFVKICGVWDHETRTHPHVVCSTSVYAFFNNGI
jgi:hypothetical protein